MSVPSRTRMHLLTYLHALEGADQSGRRTKKHVNLFAVVWFHVGDSIFRYTIWEQRAAPHTQDRVRCSSPEHTRRPTRYISQHRNVARIHEKSVRCSTVRVEPVACSTVGVRVYDCTHNTAVRPLRCSRHVAVDNDERIQPHNGGGTALAVSSSRLAADAGLVALQLAALAAPIVLLDRP